MSGITGVKLRAGPARKAKLQVRGKGPVLYPPAPELLMPDVVVQLLIDDGNTTECFKTAFPGPSGEGRISKQDATTFQAIGP